MNCRPVVVDAFIPFTSPLEGVVEYMYADVKGLVTVAIGNLIDPIELAYALPFVRPDGGEAFHEDIERFWFAVKHDPKAAKFGHRYAKHIYGNDLRLTPEGITQVVNRKLGEMDAYLTRRFEGYPSWCADAQLATLSMAWACGPAFNFPKLADALNRCDFVEASRECTISTKGNPGIAPRNLANKLLYVSASTSQDCPDELHWPF